MPEESSLLYDMPSDAFDFRGELKQLLYPGLLD